MLRSKDAYEVLLQELDVEVEVALGWNVDGCFWAN